MMNTLAKRLSAVVAVLLVTWVLLPAPGSAQIPIPGFTSPTPEPTPTETEDPDPEPEPEPTRTKEPSREGEGTSGGSRSVDGTRKSTSTSRPLSKSERKGIAEWRSRQHSTARTTTRLLKLIQRATPDGAPTRGDLREGFGRFPVAGYVWYQDDYGAPRCHADGCAFHAGTDLFAITGTPVTAVVDGTVTRVGHWSISGNAIWLMGDDGVQYYYGHLASYRSDLAEGSRVRAGEQIGRVGNTGSALDTYPHVHFEVNPLGLGTVSPKPILDMWLDEAESAARERVQELKRADQLAPMGAARWDILFDILTQPAPPPSVLWAAGFGGAATIAPLDLALADLMSASPPFGGISPRPFGTFDSLETLLQPRAD